MNEENKNVENQPVATTQELPKDLGGWNWGAFLLTWIWGIGNQVWWGLLALIPIGFVQLGVAIYLGVKGNELAWQARKYESVAQFKETQKKWAIAGLIVFIVQIILIAVFMAVVFSVIVAAVKDESLKNTSSYSPVTQQFSLSKDLDKLSDGVKTYKQIYNRMPETLNEVLIDDNLKVIMSLDGLNSVPKDSQNNQIKYCLDGENFIFAYKNSQNTWQYYNPLDTDTFTEKEAEKYICK